MNYWLMKSEPHVFSISDLEKERESLWDGVRNYQARNFMMKDMKIGDQVLFYHSNTKPPHISGLATVSSKALPDPTSWEPNSEYFDPKSSPEKPRWHCVTVKFKEKFSAILSLDEIKKHPELQNMLVAQKGQRLSIQPVEKKHFDIVLKFIQTKEKPGNEKWK